MIDTQKAVLRRCLFLLGDNAGLFFIGGAALNNEAVIPLLEL